MSSFFKGFKVSDLPQAQDLKLVDQKVTLKNQGIVVSLGTLCTS